MDIRDKNKWQVRTAVLAIFLFGFVAGLLALNVYHGWRQTREQTSGKDRFEQTFEKLQLSEEQQLEVRGIFSDAKSQMLAIRRESSPRIAGVRRQTDERLQKVLTLEQWQQFQQIRNERRAGAITGRENNSR